MLGRLATADGSGQPHVVPTSFRLDKDAGVIRVGGHRVQVTKKWRDVEANPRAAFVVDDLASTDPWRVRGIEVRGTATVRESGGEDLGPGFGPTWIEIKPTRIVSWGVESDQMGPPNARSVG